MLKSDTDKAPNGSAKSLWTRAKEQIILLARHKDPPHKIALGAALGIFVGILPIMGIQMAVVSIFALPMRGNLKAAIAGVWISNPITFIPIYYINYRFGLLFFSNRKVSWHEFSGVIESASEWDWSAVKASALNLINMGTDILIPLWGGSVILSAIFGTLTYFLGLRVVNNYRAKRSVAK